MKRLVLTCVGALLALGMVATTAQCRTPVAARDGRAAVEERGGELAWRPGSGAARTGRRPTGGVSDATGGRD